MFRMLTFCFALLNINCIVNVYAVEFREEPKSAVVTAGEDKPFICTVSDMRDEHQFAWYKGNTQLTHGENVITSLLSERLFVTQLETYSGTMSILTINDVISSDSGSYTCAILNSGGRSLRRSEAAQLIVHSLPGSQYPLCSVSKTIAVVGSNTTLTCKSESVQPPVDLFWTENNKIIRDGINTLETVNGVINEFTLLLTKENHGMKFICKQISDFMPSNHSSCSVGPLNVRYRPYVKIQHTSPVLPAIETVIFCQTFANPPVDSYKWTFYPQIEGSEYMVDITGQVLTILKPTLQQSGTNVTCTARNQVGKSSSSIQLLVALSDVNQGEHTTGKSIHKTKSENEGKIHLSLDVVIIIVAGVVIIVILVVLVPVYHYCLCRKITLRQLIIQEI
ncbi:cell adhesion molecule 2-like [Anneissia japonica]|uniref:cell adhesion molecule 2-like n=1 Tax=Anneissia japonica TaxID=1529436 RepID=UPI001425BB5F|nr:cell adhesion molecule 2-like [Anneissia japonica]